ncbi:siderophore-interacting protein [Marinomonas sp. C2222]|uniref:Siderophore-interacting protein n=1 Tax=Marinomonas sargassi TaxID=2984494 RepID=A0ABT2YNK7_9GAMM|nr:siderophore-interacting protein [Marinomonas sargassi]MCV2401471.1 siderophore-interacting protein [Marinomonas sargassi]
MPVYENVRVEVPLKERLANVVSVVDLSPTLRRVRLQGADLHDFQFDELAPEIHVKLFFPTESQPELRLPKATPDGKSADWSGLKEGLLSPCRNYTIRAFDAEAGTVDIDLVLHDEGVGGPWAKQAQVGQTLGLFGPRSWKFPPLGAVNYVFFADETSVPALARWLEILPSDAKVEAFIEMPSAESEIPLPHHGGATIHWLQNNDGFYGESLINAANNLSSQALNANTWVWGATEAHAVASLKRFFLQESGVNPSNIDVVAYWKQD